jgi:integrase/recombinase XerC
VRLREKGGKRHAMPCHHNLEKYLIAYLDGAELRGDPNGPLFRTIRRGTGKLTRTVLPQGECLCDDRPARGSRRDRNQTRQPQFPGDGDHGLSQERWNARKGRGDGDHVSTRTTQLYDRRRDELSLDEVERIVI